MTTFGKYELTPLKPGGPLELGSGGMSVVYSAKDPSGRMVALKVLRATRMNDPEARARFALEPKLYPMHPNIVRVYDVGEVKGTPYFAMELVQGESLQDMIDKRGSIPASELALILKDVAAALDAVHQRGIIHRDIKPSNILIRASDKHVFLTDFGVARAPSYSSEPVTRANFSAPGTAAYMSPEQVEGDPNLTSASDVYSLAATAYHALTGKPPFNFEDEAVVRLKHATDLPAAPNKANSAVSKAVSEVIMRAMQKQPSVRYASAGGFANALISALLPAKTGGLPIKWMLMAAAAFFGVGMIVALFSAINQGGAQTQPTATPLLKSTNAVVVTVAPVSTLPLVRTTTVAPTLAPSVGAPPTPTLAPTFVSPTFTPKPTLTPTVTSTVQLSVPAQGGSERFFKPPAGQPCTANKGSQEITYRFTVGVEIKNNSDADLSNWRPVLVERAPDGSPHDLITCGFAPPIAAGSAQMLSFFGDSDTQSVIALELRDERQAVLAKVCFFGLKPAPC